MYHHQVPCKQIDCSHVWYTWEQKTCSSKNNTFTIESVNSCILIHYIYTINTIIVKLNDVRIRNRDFIWILLYVHQYIAQARFWKYYLKCSNTAQKMKFSIMDFFSKCDQIHRKLRLWSHLLKKSLWPLSVLPCFVLSAEWFFLRLLGILFSQKCSECQLSLQNDCNPKTLVCLAIGLQ